ncbi:MATE family efflux transporter [Vibrio agarivorans]|uniref:MATE family efflux transporter n=1 Tax=Vibrio agarivorans TaxID=153622 RepID=UPI002231DDD4|nr:MATE family efflux transporter [Vibrio agarivorans]
MRLILSLAFPLIISQLIALTLVLTDIWFMSRMSVSALAAGGLGASVYNFVFIMVSSVVGCVANLIAISYGRLVVHREAAESQINHTVKGGIIVSVLVSFGCLFLFILAPNFLVKAGQPYEVIDDAMLYLDAVKWAMLPSLFILVLRGLASATGNVRSVMYMSIATVLINIPLSYLLAFPMNLGLAGLGYGTALSAFIVMAGYGYWLFRHPSYTNYVPWKNLSQYRINATLPIIGLGLPIMLAALMENGLIYGGTLLAGTISVTALAIHQVLLQCLSFTWNVNFGFSQAAAILVGRQFGSNDFDAIKATSLKSFILMTVLSVVFCALFIAFPEVIINMFNLNDSGEGAALLFKTVLWVVAISFVVDAWQLLAINLLRGMKIVKGPTVVTAIGYWGFGIPSAWYLTQHYELTGIWGGIGIGLAVTGVILVIMLQQRLSKATL